MSKSIYERVLDLRDRISLDGDGTIYNEDYLLLDEVLELIENISGEDTDIETQIYDYNNTVDIIVKNNNNKGVREMITHEQARQHLEDKIKDGNILTVLEYIKQQEKREKLLELYKEYFKYSEMLKDGRKFGGRMLVEHERDKIIEEIKELENE